MKWVTREAWLSRFLKLWQLHLNQWDTQPLKYVQYDVLITWYNRFHCWRRKSKPTESSQIQCCHYTCYSQSLVFIISEKSPLWLHQKQPLDTSLFHRNKSATQRQEGTISEGWTERNPHNLLFKAMFRNLTSSMDFFCCCCFYTWVFSIFYFHDRTRVLLPSGTNLEAETFSILSQI